MIAVIFEAWTAAGQQQTYLDLAAALRPQLEKLEGFVSIERFQSLADPSKLLSLSFFEDEQAVARWRNLASHRATQARGSEGIFEDYRLRVASVVRDYGQLDRAEAPTDSLAAHGGVVRRPKTEGRPCPPTVERP